MHVNTLVLRLCFATPTLQRKQKFPEPMISNIASCCMETAGVGVLFFTESEPAASGLIDCEYIFSYLSGMVTKRVGQENLAKFIRKFKHYS